MNQSIPGIVAADVRRWTHSSHIFTLLALALLTFSALLLTSCKQSGSNGKPDNVEYYTCTMPGMPGMPMDGGANAPASGETPTEFSVPVERQQQIGVTYASVSNHPFALSVRAVGTVAYDKQRHWDYVARVDGYVQKLSVFSRGELVEKDAPLLTIYSPDLLTTQNEFVDVLKTRDEIAGNGDKVVLEGMQLHVHSY